MRRIKTYIALLLISALCIGFSACGGKAEVSGYRLVDSLASGSFSMAFRKDDKLGNTVAAALSVLTADGTVARLAQSWFGDNPVSLSADENALSELDEEIAPERVFIMGIDIYSFPMSYRESSGEYAGFDLDLAGEVCRLLGWTLQVQPISPADAAIELSSGNIDCAWGGMCLELSSDEYSAAAYMENKQVLLVRAGSGIKNLRDLKGKTLFMPDRDFAAAVLESEKDLNEKLDSVRRLTADARTCLKYLDTGRCDVILIDSAAAKYFMK